MKCPLCGSEATAPYLPESLDAYRECAECRLVFLEPRARIGLQAERARYLQHHNSPSDEGYRQHLMSAIEPLVEGLQSRSARRQELGESGGGASCLGLDFGCGPEPVAQLLMQERGYPCLNYDPFFAFEPELLQRRYDFVLCIEVVEHLREPGLAWQLLHRLLRPEGALVVRTELLDAKIDFPTWWYRQDSTHICFYRAGTMRWLEERYAWKMTQPNESVRIFVRQET